MINRSLRWYANAPVRQQQLVKMLVLGAVFTFVGGFGALGRFVTMVVAEYHLVAGEAASQTAEGQKSLKLAARLLPGSPRGHLSLAQAYYADEWYEGAIQEGRRAFELTQDPVDKSYAISIVGFAQMNLKREAEALDSLKLALELDPTNAKAQVALQQLEQKGQ